MPTSCRKFSCANRSYRARNTAAGDGKTIGETRSAFTASCHKPMKHTQTRQPSTMPITPELLPLEALTDCRRANSGSAGLKPGFNEIGQQTAVDSVLGRDRCLQLTE